MIHFNHFKTTKKTFSQRMWRQLEVRNLKLTQRPSTGLKVTSDFRCSRAALGGLVGGGVGRINGLDGNGWISERSLQKTEVCVT